MGNVKKHMSQFMIGLVTASQLLSPAMNNVSYAVDNGDPPSVYTDLTSGESNNIDLKSAAGLPSTLDGNNVERFDIEWRSDDGDGDRTRYNGVYTDNGDKILKYKINFGLSGHKNYEAGSVIIRVPKTIFRDRKGNPIGYTTFGVAKAPDTNGEFSYTETEDAYVITNNRTMKAASSGYIEATIKGLTPSEIKDIATGNISEKLKADLIVNLQKGPMGKVSNLLDATFDTTAGISGAILRGNDNVTDKFPEHWDQSLKPTNPEDYYYASFVSSAVSKANQYYNVGVKFNARKGEDSKNAIVLGGDVTRTGKKITTNKDSGEVIGEVENAVYLKDGENFTTRFYVAYPKRDFTKEKVYDLASNVEYTMTSLDDNKVTKTTAPASVRFQPLKLDKPQGSFGVYKEGDGPVTVNSSLGKEGVYDTALNILKSGREAEIRFNVTTSAYGGKFTLKDGTTGEALSDYGYKPYKLVTDDYMTSFHVNSKELSSSDFDIKALDFKSKPLAQKFTALENKDSVYVDGVKKEFTGADSKPLFGYANVQASEIPDTVVYGRISNGDWVKFGRVSYANGTTIIPENGASVSGARLVFPENVTDYKTEVETTLAYYSHTVNLVVDVKPSADIMAEVNKIYAEGSKPMAYFVNKAKLDVNYGDNYSVYKNAGEVVGRDQLHGFYHGIEPGKRLVRSDNDVSGHKVDLTYELSSKIKTNLTTKEGVEKAAKDGWFKEQKEGVFYDLLPQGVIPNTSSIKPTRDGDKVTSIKAHENYKNTGRTLLEIHMSLKPSYKYDNSENVIGAKGYYDEPSVRFDAKYPWFNYHNLGKDLENIAAYSSAHEVGDVSGLKTEHSPKSGLNRFTNNAFDNESEKELMNGLPGDNFVYAKATDHLDVDTNSKTSLWKEVDVNDEGNYGDGLDNTHAKNVYEGGRYKYHIGMKNTETSKSKDLVFFDNLERFKPTADHEDFGDTTWHGTFQDIDVSTLRTKGANPIVYYSTRDNLVLDSETNRSDMDLNDSSKWTTERPKDLTKIKAIAVDARRKADGSEFILDPGASLGFDLTMKAPQVPNDSWYDRKLEAGQKESGLVGGAHAYNNIAMTGRTIDSDSGRVGENTLIRQDYVKVGLKPFKLKVNKSWNDDNDRDGKRKKVVTMELVANGNNMGNRVVLNEGNSWTAEFAKAPYLDNDGNVINYTLREEGAPEYDLKIKSVKNEGDFIVYDTENYHEPELIKIKGEKRWNDESDHKRPTSIKIALKANGRVIRELNVKPVDGKWLYEFDKLNKYEDGHEIEYTLEEESYVEGYKTIKDGYDITNEYHPYADVYVKKEVEGMTEKARELNPDFTFVMNLKDASGNAVVKEFEYETTLGRTGKIFHGKEFTLKKDEEMKVKGVLSEHIVSFKEVRNPNGYKLVRTEGLENSIKAGRDTHTLFVNKYETKGQAEIRATKKLKGRELFNNEFKFNLTRDGKVEQVATNRANGNVTFSGIEFTGDEAGVTRVYEINEMNTGAGGVQYDAHKETVRVTAYDNGDGTMRTNVVYDEDGANFNNVYEARGKISLKAWKEMKGGKLGDKVFDFVVKDGEKVVAHGQNDKNGTINFSEMEFTQADVGKTFNLIASEVAGNDDTVIYDNTTINYTVEVRDNFDGTLSFNVTARDNFVADIGNATNVPLFVNKYKDGSLAIEKRAENGSNEEFRFRVTLRGENLPNGRTTIRRENVENSNAGVTGAILGGLRSALVGIITPKVAKAADDEIPQPSGSIIARGEDGVAWELYENGYLLFKPVPGKDTLINNGGDPTWKREHGSNINYVGFSSKVYLPSNSRYLFGSRSGRDERNFKPTYIDGSMMDVSRVSDMSNLFYTSEKLKKLDVSNWNTSNVTDMSGVFRSTKQLTELNVVNWDTSKVTTMDGMFMYNESLINLDVSNWNVSKVTSFAWMFYYTPKHTTLDISRWDVSSSGSFYYGFAFNGTKKLDFSNWKIKKDASFTGMIHGIPLVEFKFNGDFVKYALKYAGDPTPKIQGYESSWNRDDEAYTYASWSNDLKSMGPEQAGTWLRKKLRTDYTVEFNTNGTGESMLPVKVEKDQDAKLPIPGIRKPGSKFKGWSKSQNGSVITDLRNLTTPGQKVTLYAIWDTVDNDINIQNGTFEVSVFGNERVILEGLPAGVEYTVEELTKEGWTLVSESNASGTIKPKETSTANFVNTNSPVASAGIKARKLLDGKNAGGFEFELVQDGTVKGKVISNGDGSINFDRITYNNPGEFDYTIREVRGTDNAIMYDTSIKRVHVSVTRDGSKLVSNVTYPDGVVFNNSSKTGSIKVSKRVIDNTDNEREFTFIMTLNGREEQFTLHNGEEKVFSGIKYGTTYKVQEVNIPSEYSLASLTNASGTIDSNQEVDVVAINQYKTNGSFVVNAKKVLQNRELRSGEFTFELVDEAGQVVDSAKNDENGNITFNAISINEAGIRNYKIREKVGSDENIKYDTHEENVRVVTTNVNGRTETRVEYDIDGAVFTNKYEPKVVTGDNLRSVKISKKLQGTNVNRAFNLKVDVMKDGKLMENAFEYSSNLDSTVKSFISGNKIEIHKDEVITINGVPEGATVKVVEDKYSGYRVKEGSEITKVVNGDDNNILITNVYESYGDYKVRATKNLIGGNVKDYKFNFLIMKDGEILGRTTNNGSEIEFSPLNFTNKDIGKIYEYELVEDNSGDVKINYDNNVYRVRLTVLDNGDGTIKVVNDNENVTFNNSIKAELPITGGYGTTLVLIGLFGVVIVVRRKYN